MRGVLSRNAGGWCGLFRWDSLRTRLIFWNVLTLAVLLGILGVVTRAIVLSSMMASIDRELDVRTRPHRQPSPPRGPGPNAPPRANAPFDEQGPGPARDAPPRPEGPRRGPEPGNDPGPPRQPREDVKNPYRPVHFDVNGHTVENSNYTQPLDPKGFQEALQGRIHRGNVLVDGEPMRVLSRPFPQEGPPEGVVQAPYPLTEMYLAIDSLNSALLLLAPIGLIGAGMVGAFLTDQVLRRVRRLTQAAGRISVQELSERLPAAGADEFSELAQTFNSLLGRLQTAFQKQERLIEQQRRFTADASHELKTPLTIVKGNAGLLLGSPRADAASVPALQEIDQAADTMNRLVQDLLLLARSDDGQLGGNPIELLVSEVLQRAASRIGSRPAAVIHWNIPASLTVHGNEQELLRLFTNLLGNAVNYTPLDGQITVTATPEGQDVRVMIADTDIGIAPEHLPHLGERFYRVDTSRTRSDGGTGLGLSICRSIVQAHHGELAIQSTVGVGTTVIVTLPA